MQALAVLGLSWTLPGTGSTVEHKRSSALQIKLCMSFLLHKGPVWVSSQCRSGRGLKCVGHNCQLGLLQWGNACVLTQQQVRCIAVFRYHHKPQTMMLTQHCWVSQASSAPILPILLSIAGGKAEL